MCCYRMKPIVTELGASWVTERASEPLVDDAASALGRIRAAPPPPTEPGLAGPSGPAVE